MDAEARETGDRRIDGGFEWAGGRYLRPWRKSDVVMWLNTRRPRSQASE
jgi:hypothetical protein